MTRERAYDAVRRLARVDDEQVATVAGAEGREALLEGIVSMPVPTTTPAPRRRRRASVIGGGIAVTLAASGTIGWAIAVNNPRDTTALQCAIPDSPSIVDAVSGDPVADCAAEWERQRGEAPPALVAYDNGHGGVLVQPATEPAPPGSSPFAGTQNLALIQLGEALDDYVAGLNSRCLDEPAAVSLTKAKLAELGLHDWTVTTRRNPGATCFDRASPDPGSRTVLVIGAASVQDPSSVDMILARRLRKVAATCQSLPEAKAAVERAASDLGLSSDPSFVQYRITSVATDAKCTTIRQRVGGAIFVTLRGPRG
ncbi:MAG TPA: hypothetical protein VNA20_05315 [Frankiaceae bacterium]|nr:hypothetical protein [Frankiaceae bacterium]